MSDHTPLPWTLNPKPHASWIGMIGNNPDDPQLWSTDTPFPQGDKRADAELIVCSVNALPALVKALEEIANGPIYAIEQAKEKARDALNAVKDMK